MKNSRSLSILEASLLKTLLYFDIFDFPPSFEEIEKFFIECRADSKEIKKLLDKNTAIENKNRFYFIKGREGIVQQRVQREKNTVKKLALSKNVIKKLRLIPSVRLVGLSGGVSMGNSKKQDDIDFFVITAPHTIWITRLVVILVLKSMGVHRGKRDRHTENKICVNMFVDGSRLSFGKSRQDLYTAHEIAHMIPLYDVRDTYKNFVSANRWIFKYLPNSQSKLVQNPNPETSTTGFLHRTVVKLLSIVDPLAKLIQLPLIKRNRTREEVSDFLLAFHPFDYREQTRQQYMKRISEFDI